MQNRIRVISFGFMAIAGLTVLRLFYLQVIKHGYYTQLATSGHMRKYEIAARRGEIYLQSRGELTPVALNRNLKTLYADPRYIKNKEKVAQMLADVTKKDYKTYLDAIEKATVYVELEKALEPSVARAIEDLELSGIGLSDNFTRDYPEGSLAAHLLGFVNADGKGQYGVEEYFNDQLDGVPGLLNAKTDTRGIPIATTDNVQIAPINGNNIVLTIDRNLQAQVEQVLKEGFEKYRPKSASAVIMDPNTGAVKAMANYPTFDPNKYREVEDYSVFLNTVTNGLFEPGSGFKVFSMATGLNIGKVTPNTTYQDSGFVTIDDYTIKNAEPGSGTRTMTQVITKSLNTGVVFVLKAIGGGQITDQAKRVLHDYYTTHFRFGTPTGIEQPGEPSGFVATPQDTSDVGYANMTFGQGVTATMMQTVGAMAAVVNGGTYYQPYLVDYTLKDDGTVSKTEPKVLATNVVNSQTSDQMKAMMETVVEEGGGFGTKISGYKIGGKTGTAQIPNPEGGYFDNRDIGSFTGAAPLDKPEYVMMVRVDEPHVPGFAGSGAAGPMFGNIMKWLLNYSGIPPSN